MTSHNNLLFRQDVVSFSTKLINKLNPAQIKIDTLIGVELYVGGPELDALISSYIPAYKRGSIFLTASIRRKNSDRTQPFELESMDIYYDNTKIVIAVPSDLSPNLAMEQCLGDIFEQVILTDNPIVKFGRVDGVLRPMRVNHRR